MHVHVKRANAKLSSVHDCLRKIGYVVRRSQPVNIFIHTCTKYRVRRVFPIGFEQGFCCLIVMAGQVPVSTCTRTRSIRTGRPRRWPCNRIAHYASARSAIAVGVRNSNRPRNLPTIMKHSLAHQMTYRECLFLGASCLGRLLCLVFLDQLLADITGYNRVLTVLHSELTLTLHNWRATMVVVGIRR